MLIKQELTQLTRLLSKAGNVSKGLPQPLFEALLKLVVFPSCEVVVTNGQGGVLLTYRKDKFWRGWHFPGRLIRYGQSFEQCLKQVVKTELGSALEFYEFLLPLDYSKGRRGPGVGLVFLCKIKGRPKDGKFFKAMPKNIIPEHKELWRGLKRMRIVS